MEGLIGIIGGGVFFLSWLIQSYETKKSNKVIFSKKFFITRIIASLILLTEAVRVQSAGFFLLYIATIAMMGYNLIKIKGKTKII
jgi:lipid-A-disaccharide synthase-like uncharacterized protein